MWENNAVQAGYLAGEQVRSSTWVYGALLPSGAECCLALASAVAGDEVDFVEMMNARAAELGMADTHFTTPSACTTIGITRRRAIWRHC